MRKTIRNIFVIGLSNVFQSGGVFLKGVILARILGVHQFGGAVIIISITSALDLFADAGVDRFIVQNRFGYRSDILRTAHAFRFGGSVAIGLVILALSYPLALVFQAPELWWPIAATGGVVSLRGLSSLYYKLQQREHRFESETVIDVGRVAADLACTAIVALWTHSILAVLAGAYANALAQMLISHLQSRGRYSFMPRRALIGLVGRFSVPVYINALMLFAAMQGDRMVVGAMFNRRQLAMYAVACTLGAGVATLISKVIERLLLPVMSNRDLTKLGRRRQTNLIGAVIVAGSVLFLIGVSVVAPSLIRIIYGPAYTGLSEIVFAAAIFQMIQIQQSWLTSLLVANGSTSRFPLITLMRAAAFPTAILFRSLGFSLVSIPLAFALGATLSLGVSYQAARPLELVDRRLVVASFATIAVAIAFAVAFSMGLHP
jgi:O-antigen/teichoic acid export membrane protein